MTKTEPEEFEMPAPDRPMNQPGLDFSTQSTPPSNDEMFTSWQKHRPALPKSEWMKRREAAYAEKET